MERLGLTIPTESLNTVIIVSTASATGLIVLLVLNLFVCGCIVAMCLKQRNEPTYQRCTPTSVPSVPSIRAPVRVQFQEEANYSEIAPRTEDMFQMRLIQNHRITMSQPHLMTTSFGPHGLHSEHVAMSQPHLSTRQWISQRTTSFENIYSSVVDSQEDLTEEHIHQVPLYRELEGVPMRREYSSERHLSLGERAYTLQNSLSQSAEITLI